MLLGGFCQDDLLGLLFYRGRPSIFFAVELGAVTSFLFIFYVKNLKEKKPHLFREKVRSWVPTILLVKFNPFARAVFFFFDTEFFVCAGIICMVCGIIALLMGKICQ